MGQDENEKKVSENQFEEIIARLQRFFKENNITIDLDLKEIRRRSQRLAAELKLPSEGPSIDYKYLEEKLKEAFNNAQWDEFNRLLDELIFSRYLELQRIQENVDPTKLEYNLFYVTFLNLFYGDLFYFCFKFPVTIQPSLQQQKTEYKNTYLFFKRFFERLLQRDAESFRKSEEFFFKITESAGKIIHDYGNILSKLKDRLTILHMQEMATLIGDIFEIVKNLFSFIDRTCGSQLKASFDRGFSPDPQLNKIINRHLDRNIRNFRFHSNIELVNESTVRITFQNGTSKTYTSEQLGQIVIKSLVLWDAVTRGYFDNIESTLSIMIPNSAKTTFFKVLTKCCKENPEMFPMVLEYFGIRLQENRLLQEAFRFSQRERLNLVENQDK